MSFSAVGFGFLPAVIYFHNQAVFLWAFPVKPDTIGTSMDGAIKPFRHSGEPT
jgi:hypothetical protein